MADLGITAIWRAIARHAESLGYIYIYIQKSMCGAATENCSAVSRNEDEEAAVREWPCQKEIVSHCEAGDEDRAGRHVRRRG